MYTDTLDKSRSLIEQASDDGSTVFIATINPDGTSGNAAFFGNVERMVQLLVGLIKLSKLRNEGKVLKEVSIEAFSRGLINIE